MFFNKDKLKSHENSDEENKQNISLLPKPETRKTGNELFSDWCRWTTNNNGESSMDNK